MRLAKTWPYWYIATLVAIAVGLNPKPGPSEYYPTASRPEHGPGAIALALLCWHSLCRRARHTLCGQAQTSLSLSMDTMFSDADVDASVGGARPRRLPSDAALQVRPAELSSALAERGLGTVCSLSLWRPQPFSRRSMVACSMSANCSPPGSAWTSFFTSRMPLK
eukprot:3376883-Rhodomonas_salina.1